MTLIATVFGAGFLPGAPGTFGSLAAMPLVALLGFTVGGWGLLGASLLVTAVGTWAADRYCQITGRHDNQQIVIDEVAGYLLTMVLVPCTVLSLLAGFGLFRLFDGLKPWPVSVIDRRVHGGFGVMADDLAAGVIGALVLYGIYRLTGGFFGDLRQQYGLPPWLVLLSPCGGEGGGGGLARG